MSSYPEPPSTPSKPAHDELPFEHEKPSYGQAPSGLSRRSKIIIGAIATTVAIGLTVGLAVGLTGNQKETPKTSSVTVNVGNNGEYKPYTIDFNDVVEYGKHWAPKKATNNTDIASYVYSAKAHMHERQAESLMFFLKKGIQTNIDYVFILNDDAPRAIVDAIPKRDNVFIYHKDNSCFDLGSHPLGIRYVEKKTGKKYKRLALLNSSVRGPFMPHDAEDCWSDRLFKPLDENVKLVGTVHGCMPQPEYEGQFVMQSMVLAYDRIGYKISKEEQGTLACQKTFEKTWRHGERGNLHRLRKAGYEGAFLSHESQEIYEKFDGTCPKEVKAKNDGFVYDNQNATEILFWKINRFYGEPMVGRVKAITAEWDATTPKCPYHVPFEVPKNYKD